MRRKWTTHSKMKHSKLMRDPTTTVKLKRDGKMKITLAENIVYDFNLIAPAYLNYIKEGVPLMTYSFGDWTPSYSITNFVAKVVSGNSD